LLVCIIDLELGFLVNIPISGEYLTSQVFGLRRGFCLFVLGADGQMDPASRSGCGSFTPTVYTSSLESLETAIRIVPRSLLFLVREISVVY
jgi:hypothetical protein